MSQTHVVIQLLIAAGGAGLLTWFIQTLLLPVAVRLDLIDRPAGRKDHIHPTPVIGGFAMALAALAVSMIAVGDYNHGLTGFACGSAVLIGVGLLDDKYNLPWPVRIIAQAIAALLMIYIGGVQVERLGPVFGLGDTTLGAFSVPFTVFATVGLINAVNMIDGADGLAGTLVLAALVMLTAAALYAGNDNLALGTGILAGTVAGFLAFNLRMPWRPRAKLFMGNAGSMFLGFVIAWASFRLTQNPDHDVSPVLALWLLPIPVMDTLVLMLRRVRLGKSPFHADRNHIHHLMIEAGMGPTRAALWLAAFSCICGLLCGLALLANIPEPILLGLYFLLCAAWYSMTSRRQRAVDFFHRLQGMHLRVPGVL